MRSMLSFRSLLAVNMKTFYLFVCFFGFFTLNCAAESSESDCQKKAKALVSLETAEELLSKAENFLPPCREDSNSVDESQCNGKTPLAYIDISKKCISDAKEYFSGCPAAFEQDEKPRDCSEIFTDGHKSNGVYTIWPRESSTIGEALQVYCDMETDGGGWTMIQRRGKFPVQTDFAQDWENYKNGFGNITEEFWLGNENIRVLCHKGCQLRFYLEDTNGTKGFAMYQNFNLTGDDYTIHTSGYEGDVGDSMVWHNGRRFSTKDNGDAMLFEKLRGGWWYSYVYVCLNGRYAPGENSIDTVVWISWRHYNCLGGVEMKVKPN